MILVFKTNKVGTKVPKHTTSHLNTTVMFVINLNISILKSVLASTLAIFDFY